MPAPATVPQHWLVFAACVIGTMLLDLALFGRKTHAIAFREAALKSLLWVAVGLGFTGYVYGAVGPQQGIDYLVAYLVEKSLSVDNLFVFLVVFDYFQVKERHQPRILAWGILGALLLRAAFIVAGTEALHRLHFTMYLFGAFLVFSGVKLAFRGEESIDPQKSLGPRVARRYLRFTSTLDGDRFFTKRDGKWYATPLFLVLTVIETTDLMFAVDSVPAVLAITTDLFVVYTSNILAILGLRALYFLLAGVMKRFRFLDKGLAAVLAFVGIKMLIADWYKIPSLYSLAVIASILVVAVVASLAIPERHGAA
ncbi:MAG TPA: TerC family protein [Polyangiaceae bacterium]|nr:TerC family protein [Polyangiaceae bacterium]